MFRKILDTRPLLIFIGIPVILLLLFFLLDKNDAETAAVDFNKYHKTLPTKYSELLSPQDKTESSFFSVINKSDKTRELLVFKPFPVKKEAKAIFEIKVTPNKNNNNNKPFILTLEREAAIYNYNNVTYGLYRKALPYINIDNIVVTRKVKNKYQKKLNDTILNPFTKINSSFKTGKNLGSNSTPNTSLSLFTNALKQKDIQFLPYQYTIVKNKLYQSRTELNNFIKSQNITLATIEKPKLFWEALNIKSKELSNLISFSGINSKPATQLITEYIQGNKKIDSVFNIKKIAQYVAIKNLFSSRCNEKLYFIYNPNNSLIEPYFVNSECLGGMSDYLEEPKINNQEFIEDYLNNLIELTELDVQEDIVEENTNFKEELSLINSYYPENIFDVDILQINQRLIFKNINNQKAIKTEILEVNEKSMVLTIENLSNYPVIINGLSHEKKKSITSLNPRKQIVSKVKDTITIDLPRSFENLFVSKKNKATGFVLYKHIYELYISYSTLGSREVNYSNIIPYQQKEAVATDLFRDPININKQEGIAVYEKKKIITFKKKDITISYPLIIPEGYNFVINAGQNIDIIQGGKIISHAPVFFKGTEQRPIKVYSSDKKGQGILVLSEGKENIVNHTTFDFLTNPEHGNWSVTGAVTFYESPVTLNYVTVSNNRCEDALNIIRTTFVINQCKLENTQSDAFDGDFVTGIIKDSKFINLGNDAIDISGSNLTINNVQIIRAGDKGLSAGEDSKMTVNNVSISTSEIAVAGKDLSIINAKNLNIENTKLAFTAFQKKPEFGPSHITINGVKMNNVDIEHLVESTSSLLIDGKKVKTSQNVKDRMYGAEFGVSSDETRNKQYKN